MKISAYVQVASHITDHRRSSPEQVGAANPGTTARDQDKKVTNENSHRTNLPRVEQVMWVNSSLDFLHQFDGTNPKFLIKVFALSNPHSMFPGAGSSERDSALNHSFDNTSDFAHILIRGKH